MRISLLVPIFVITTFIATAQPKQICITIDDLPTVHYGENNQEEITRKLIAHFREYTLPAIGFVNEGKLYESGVVSRVRVALLQQWLDNGYELGNHTFGHTDYHRASFADFSQDVLKGEEITPTLSKQAGLPWRYFRHPYLHIGQSPARYDSLRSFLNAHGYTEAPVTIDNDDYLFAKAYSNAHKKNDQSLMNKIGTDYIQYMESKVHYYEGLSSQLFNREIPQILLIHANLLNADYLGELASMYQQNGYIFVDLKTALRDTAFREEISRFGSKGISWIERWALSHSAPNSFFASDPETPAYIINAAR